MVTLRNHIYLLTALAIGVTVVLAVWLAGGKPYYSVVRTAMPGGITLTFVDLPWNDTRRCEEARRKIVELLRVQCPACRLVLNDCLQQLDPPLEKAIRSKPSTMFAVHTDTQRIMIETDFQSARQICTSMADQIKNQGKQQARCVTPGP